jgi:hypothetical protein
LVVRSIFTWHRVVRMSRVRACVLCARARDEPFLRCRFTMTHVRMAAQVFRRRRHTSGRTQTTTATSSSCGRRPARIHGRTRTTRTC